MNKVRVIIRKEWSEVFKNRLVLFSVSFLPLVLTAMPLFALYMTRDMGDMSAAGLSDMPAGFARLCVGLNAAECAQYYLVSQFLSVFLTMPVVIPVMIASYSIVGEKRTRTLEPLLATPITTLELLAGKALAATIPALAASWLSYVVFAIGTHLLTASPLIVSRLLAPSWLLAIFGVGPLLSIAGVSIAVMISSRTNDPRVAEQLSTLVVLPLLALFVAQTSGLVALGDTLIVWIAIALIVIDSGLLYFATRLFQRETILTRWK
jgi:ABC-2 type transport system permease protein